MLFVLVLLRIRFFAMNRRFFTEMKKTILLFCFHLFAFAAIAQAPQPLRYYDRILEFHRQDSIQFPEKGQILFIGSSSFTMWKKVNESFPGYKILNRAFGGSTLSDLIAYRYDILYAYKPRQIVMYCGENDFGVKDSTLVQTVVERFKTFYRLLRQQYPKVPFVYVSMKPSPAKLPVQHKLFAANNEIKRFLASQKRSVFVDVTKEMLQPDGTPNPELFLGDKLHMNAKGYAIWQKILQPYLKRH